MKVLTVFYTLILGLLVPLTVFGDLSSFGTPTCESSFNGNLFEGSSKPKIIEKYKWVDLDSMYPTLERTEVKPASIFGKVTTSQSTYGTGVVGVKAAGNVTGPTNFEMVIGPEFNINSITLLDYLLGDAWYCTTKKSATSKRSTKDKGTYTLNGSGEVIAVSGGGGITVNGSGFRTSGTVSFSFYPTAEAKTLEVTVEQDKPKIYRCEHQDCNVELPSSDHHYITCGKEFTNHHGGVGTCKAKYYVCQSNCLLHPDTDDDGDSSASLSPSGGSYTASAGGTHTADISVPSGYQYVYWYLAGPGIDGLGLLEETDYGYGSSTSASYSWSVPSDASGDYVITAYTYLSDNSIVQPSYTVTVSSSSSTTSTTSTESSGSSSGGSIGPAYGYSDTGEAGRMHEVTLTDNNGLSQVSWYMKSPRDASAYLLYTTGYSGETESTCSFWLYDDSGDYEFTAEVTPQSGDSYSLSYTVTVE